MTAFGPFGKVPAVQEHRRGEPQRLAAGELDFERGTHIVCFLLSHR